MSSALVLLVSVYVILSKIVTLAGGFRFQESGCKDKEFFR